MIAPLGSRTLGLAAGTVLAVGFASWNIYQSIAGGPVQASVARGPVTPPAPRPIASRSGASREPAPAVVVPGARPAAGASREPLRLSPLQIAPDADPFTKLVPSSPTGQVPAPWNGAAGPFVGPVGSGTGPAGPVPGVTSFRPSPVLARTPGDGALSAAHPPRLPGVTITPVPVPSTREAPVKVPELVGTMLGDSPSAVFSFGERVVIVRIGETVGEWKITAISHGRVHLRHLSRARELTVHVGEGDAAAGDSGRAATTDQPEPSDDGFPARP